MGTTTPNISIYVPSSGETLFDQSYLAGMQNIDVHDHSGSPNRGIPIASPGIADYSITYSKLNSDVVLANGGLAVDGAAPNKLKTDGILFSLRNLATVGMLAQTAAGTSAARTLTGITGELEFTNGNGSAGNPTLSFPAPTVWSPTVYGSIIAGTCNLTVAHGRYVKLGSLVVAFGEVKWNTHNGTGNLMVGGFPHSFGAGASNYISTLAFDTVALTATYTQASLSGNSATTNATVICCKTGVSIQDVAVCASGEMQFTMIYLTG